MQNHVIVYTTNEINFRSPPTIIMNEATSVQMILNFYPSLSWQAEVRLHSIKMQIICLCM